MKPTLVVLAAGMGSRYGGLKQMDPIGPQDELILDYSIYDAIRAGFGKIVFVIRDIFEDAFKEKIGSKFAHLIEIAYVFQELDTGLNGFPMPPDRQKPWGTGHAILVAKDEVDTPCAVINADDYYGVDSFQSMASFLSGPEISADHYTMVGFTLRNTLSEHGTVARGICYLEDDQQLKHVSECTGIAKNGQGATYTDESDTEQTLTGDEVVSMNLWGFHPSIFTHLTHDFDAFLKTSAHLPTSELYIPSVVDNLIQTDQVRVSVLRTDSAWFGVTYQQDKAQVQNKMAELIQQGVYPESLWT
jgi:hypothetical protein